MRRFALFALIIALALPLLAVAPLSAQGDKSACDTAPLFSKFAALKPSGDSDKDLAALADLASQISALNIACKGKSYSGKGEKLVGPITLADGTYLVTIIGKTYIASGKVLDGKCGQSSSNTAFTAYSNAEIGRTASYIKSQSCQMMIDMTLTVGDWQIIIEPLSK